MEIHITCTGENRYYEGSIWITPQLESFLRDKVGFRRPKSYTLSKSNLAAAVRLGLVNIDYKIVSLTPSVEKFLRLKRV